MNITIAENPRSKDVLVYIDLDITLEDGSNYPFTATPRDSAGAELYKKAKRGDFGKISIAPDDSYQWNGSHWIAPSRELLISVAKAEKEARSAIAEATIAPLERAVRLSIATDEEKARLKAWETYSVLLSRIDTSSVPDIEWPVSPE